MAAFMEAHVYPAEAVHREQLRALGDPHAVPPVMEELKAEARRQGLWNLFLGDPRYGPGLTTLEYAPVAELSGRSPFLAPEALNCAPPDAGNMEVLAEYGSSEQRERWLRPLLDGEIRSCFAMTEPDVASSDATNIRAQIRREGDSWVIRGRKWWTSGVVDPRCEIAIVMGITDPEADPHHRQSMVLVPLDTPGVSVLRSLPVFGYDEGPGHGEVRFDDARVPAENLLGERGAGFTVAQARLGPGRLHHCMRAIGMAERALELMCERARTRIAFGGPLADQGVVQDAIAESRLRIDAARLMVLRAAWLIDTQGKRAARVEVSAAKIAAPAAATWVIDRAIQVHGAAGVSDDVPLAALYAHARTLRILDGPDEVHRMVIARRELGGRARAGA